MMFLECIIRDDASSTQLIAQHIYAGHFFEGIKILCDLWKLLFSLQ